MRVYAEEQEIPKIKNPVLTIGTFDGVHLGHQQILQLLKDKAEKIDGETVLFTFEPHPRMVLNPDDHNLELIQPIEDRIRLLEDFGLDHLILFPFTKEFSRLSATDFIRKIMVNQIGVKMMTIGYNHHFGRNREGSIELLRELGEIYDFEVEEQQAFRIGEISVSSTKIRSAIKAGDIELANEYLGRSFCFRGVVIKGDQLGSKIGFPTANIQPIGEHQVIPANGVYAVRTRINGTIYDGMCNIGHRPTVSRDGEQRVEINIFDFNSSIYGAEVELFFIKHIRKEQAFDNLEKLKEQLTKDEEHSRIILGHSGTPVH